MSVVVSTMFLFSVRMHERYLFPVVVITLCAFLVKPTKELFFTYVGFSFVQFINVGHVLYYFEKYDSTGPQGAILGITALLTLAVYGYMFFAAFSKTEIQEMKELEVRRGKKKAQKAYIVRQISRKEEKKPEKKKFSIMASKGMEKFTKWDWIVLVSIMVLYSAFALHDLGRMSAPETSWVSGGSGSAINIDLGEEKNIKMIYTFLGNYEERKFTLDFSQDGKNYETVGEVRADSVFCWNEMKQEDNEDDSYKLLKAYRYIRLTSNDNESVLNELVIVDKNGKMLTPANKDKCRELFDEQEEYDSQRTFRSGTYFDEIYHARTAYEMTQPGTYCYENTHPPLGKYLISLGIRAFGMNPFGWRIVGVLFGIGMLPFMYLFGRRLFGCQTWAAGALTALFAFDFMHFTQTRISTIDVYGTFFIIAMFYFMLKYSQMSFYDTPLKKTFVPLGLSAIMMGLGCASKWTAVYAAAGLGIFFFTIMGVRFYEYKLACKNPSGTTSGISHEYIIEAFPKKLKWTLAFCVLFFIIIAGAIYLCSYIPFNDGQNTGLWSRMMENQNTMFGYHSKLKDDHPYSATWYEWPTMIRPMFYYCQTLASGLKEGISAFGNPLVWWAGIPAFLYMLYLIFKEKDRCAIFMVFAYLVQYVPWMLVRRCTFAYHYFPSVPFVTMMIVYIMVRLVAKDRKWLKWMIVYCVAAFLLFLLFLPVLSGEPVTETFVRDGLRWLSGWMLIY